MSRIRKLTIPFRHCTKIKIRCNEVEIGMRLRSLMKNFHDKLVRRSKDADLINYSKGVNIFGFIKTADAMQTYSVI